jgi:hypothetical protein
MNSFGIIREFKTKNFKVVVDAEEDYDLDLSFDEDGSVRKDLERGKLIAFSARVQVFFKGSEVATDYLGGCVYKSIEEFQDHREVGKQNAEYERKGESGRCGSYFHDMIRTACEEARKTIAAYKDVHVRAV